MFYLSAGHIDEAANYVEAALALARGVGAKGLEAHALCLAGDVSSAGGVKDGESYYCQALALAEPFGMRPFVAHCHFGLCKLKHRTGDHGQRRSTSPPPWRCTAR